MDGEAEAEAPLGGAFSIHRIERVDVFRSVMEQLERLVNQAEPKTKLPPERDLVERLGVSRVSVREALRALESMGRIEIRRNDGSYVRDPNPSTLANQLRHVALQGRSVDEEFLSNLITVRVAVEDAVMVEVPKASDFSAVAASLEASADELRTGEATAGSLDLRFEAALGKLTSNRLLSELQRSIHQLWIESWSECGLAPGHRKQLHQEHVDIFDRLLENDIPGARMLMHRHLDREIAFNGPN